MNRHGPALFAASVLAGCYTGPINMRPTVSIKAPPGLIFRGQMATFTATTSDGDEDSVAVLWVRTKDACPDGFASPANWPVDGPDFSWTTRSALSFVVGPSQTRETFCVWAKAIDGNGAARVDALTVDPANHAPTAELVRTKPITADNKGMTKDAVFPLNTDFVFSGATSMDLDAGDPRIFKWAFRQRPEGVDVNPCPNQTEECTFTATVNGEYILEMTFSDGLDVAVAEDTFMVLPGHVPLATLSVVPKGPGPFPLGTRFEAKVSTDADPSHTISPHWALSAPPNSKESMDGEPCADDPSNKTVRCFTGDADGHYELSVTVTDEDVEKTSAPVSDPLDVLKDTMPCICASNFDPTAPFIPFAHDDLNELTVLRVCDDLDPYPPSSPLSPDVAHFDWFVNEGNGFVPRNVDFDSYPIPSGEYPLGAEISVRVQIRDRDAERSRSAFADCGDSTDVCTTAGSDQCCANAGGGRGYQRVTWKVKFNR
jgi:hypothetical protein